MKKFLCFLFVILLSASVLASCGGSETTAETTTEKPTVTTAPATTDKPVTTTAPVTTDKPVTTTAPVTTDKPVTTTAPVTTEKPVTTTAPVTTEKPTTPETPTGRDLLVGDALGGLAIEDHHASTNYNPSLVFYIYGDADLYTDLRGTEVTDVDAFVNSKYTWKITANGKTFTPAKMSIFDGGDWGYFRADLGDISNYEATNGIVTFSIKLEIVDTQTNAVVYYANFSDVLYSVTGVIEDNSKPAGLTAVTGVVGVSGPDAGGDEGFEKLFDNSGKTKLCTDANGAANAIVANLGGAKTLKGISLVNANDNENSNGRTVISFEVWVSENGTDWGTAPAFSTTGDGVNKADVSRNYQERYYGFDSTVTATYVKLVINNGEMYQISEVVFYE